MNGSYFRDGNDVILYLIILQCSNFLVFEGLKFSLLEVGFLEIK
jgi:hypothetical protein